MKRCIVSLIGEQTIPNILGIRHFQWDHLLFVTTKVMEEKRKKTRAILDLLALSGIRVDPNQYDRLIVDQDSMVDIQKKLHDWKQRLGRDMEFRVNLTGGTKIMSLAAYNFFKEHGATMIYIPIPKNQYLVVHPAEQAGTFPIPSRLTVREYLAAYGFHISNEKDLQQNEAKAQSRAKASRYLYENYVEFDGFLT